ncbi:DsrE family protein [Mariniplasma anaerobium]|uniref:DsrE family protein n=1 Tax=Mariniplasma anaerobium TaxID=2735436 RepID=A0A7U9TJ32_9MOLU|nr:DsrE family protein [Mariniplasma anaerobium]BCR36207.1 hypothetical protein MPAN_011000 [Mariniplasma anaerobium]
MNKNELNVLWTNGDPITSEHFLLLYTINAQKRGWFDQVNIIVWGSPAKLIIENKRIQELVKEAMAIGVNVSGCLHCAQELGVDKELEAMGIKLEYKGIPLTELIKGDHKLITI